MANNPLRITDTILRDAHQSQAATRMRLEEMLPACEKRPVSIASIENIVADIERGLNNMMEKEIESKMKKELLKNE